MSFCDRLQVKQIASFMMANLIIKGSISLSFFAKNSSYVPPVNSYETDCFMVRENCCNRSVTRLTLLFFQRHIETSNRVLRQPAH